MSNYLIQKTEHSKLLYFAEKVFDLIKLSGSNKVHDPSVKSMSAPKLRFSCEPPAAAAAEEP